MAFRAEVLKIGVDGYEFRQTDIYPNLAPGLDAPNGSFAMVSVDGTWWCKHGSEPTNWVRAHSHASGVNGDSVPLLRGMPVVLSAGVFVRASAASQALSNTVGLVALRADPTLEVEILPAGLLSLTVDQWIVITGEIGGLTPGATYYLGADLGTMTTTPPSNPGLSLVELGVALGDAQFMISRQRPILL
jgi:hypothetical protein